MDKLAENEVNLSDLQIFRNSEMLYFQCNLADGLDAIKTIFKNIFEKVKYVDLLINGAGICNEQLMDLTVQVNLMGTIYASVAIAEYWDKRKGGPGGMIVNVASAAGLNPMGPMAVYSASKSGVITFTKCLAVSRQIFNYEISSAIVFGFMNFDFFLIGT